MKKPEVVLIEAQTNIRFPDIDTWQAYVRCPDCDAGQWIHREEFAGKRQIKCACGYKVKTKLG